MINDIFTYFQFYTPFDLKRIQNNHIRFIRTLHRISKIVSTLSKVETAVSSRSSDGAEMPPMHGRIHEAVFAREGDRTERNSL